MFVFPVQGKTLFYLTPEKQFFLLNYTTGVSKYPLDQGFKIFIKKIFYPENFYYPGNCLLPMDFFSLFKKTHMFSYILKNIFKILDCWGC